MIRRLRAWAITIAILTVGAGAHAQSSAGRIDMNDAPRADGQTLTVRALPRRTRPPLNRAAIPTIAPIILGVQPVSEPGPSTFSACPNDQYALQIPGVDCPPTVR